MAVSGQHLRLLVRLDLLATYDIRLYTGNGEKAAFLHAGQQTVDVPAYDFHVAAPNSKG